MFLESNKNLIVEGNCLDVLERLEDNSIDLVYLDPPWNQGTADFVYRDNSNIREKDYEEFIYSVVQQAKRVLKKDGNLVLYSIPFLNVNFHNLLRPVFGSDNFKAEFVIPKKRLNNSNHSFIHNHETVIFYSVSNSSKFFPRIERYKDEVNRMFPLEENGKQYRLEKLTRPSRQTNFNFEWNGFELPENLEWRFSKKRLDKLDKENNIFFGNDMLLPSLKVYSDDFSLQMIDSVWSDIDAYNTKYGDFSQSEELLDRIINLSTQENDIILDPFMGLGISGISSIKNNRRWIGIDATKEVYKKALNCLKKHSVCELSIDSILNKEIIWDSYEYYNFSISDVFLSRVTKGENERLEFKEAYHYNDHQQKKDNNLPNKIMKEISAFLNSNYGGSIFLGVRDNGEIRGLNKDLEILDNKTISIDKLDLTITSKIKDTFNGSSIDLITINFIELEKLHVCEIKISPSSEPVFIDKQFYVRNGTQATALKSEEFFNLMKKRQQLT